MKHCSFKAYWGGIYGLGISIEFLNMCKLETLQKYKAARVRLIVGVGIICINFPVSKIGYMGTK